MVQIIGENRKPSRGEKLTAFMDRGIDALNQYRNMANENEGINRRIGLDLTGIQDQQTRQQLIADQLKFGRQMKQAQASQGVNYGGQSETPSRDSFDQRQDFLNENRVQKEQLPEFNNRNFESKRSNEFSGFSQTPQPETKGRKRTVLDPDQVRMEGNRIAQEQTASGIPTTAIEGYEIARGINDENKIYNQEVEKDIEQIKKNQLEAGASAIKELNDLYPEATAEHNALVQRWGEEAAEKGYAKQSEIQREIALKVKNFKNTIANVKEGIKAPRIGTKLAESLLGESVSDEERRNGIKVKLKPLLDQGLYDTARNLLSQLNFGPEERESIISNLGENAKKTLSTLPKFKSGRATDYSEDFQTTNPEEIQRFQGNLNEVLQNDPTVNLILLRKAYEDKNIGWSDFKEAFNKAVFENDFKPTPEQLNQMNYLEYPPLNRLDKLLYNLGLIGR